MAIGLVPSIRSFPHKGATTDELCIPMVGTEGGEEGGEKEEGGGRREEEEGGRKRKSGQGVS